MSLPQCTKAMSKDSNSEEARHWGTSTTTCKIEHQIPYPATLAPVRWVRLGCHLEPRPSTDWLGDEVLGAGSFYMPWFAHWNRVSIALFGQGQDVLDGSYLVKVPGISKPMPLRVADEVDGMMDWHDVTVAIWNQLKQNSAFWCPSRPFVLLFCDADQAERCTRRRWLDSVALEYERRNPAGDDGVHAEEDEACPDEEAVDQAWVDDTEFGNDRHLWGKACDFFLHDRDNVDQIAQLPGMCRAPRNYQMLDVYKALSVCWSQDQNGVINCSRPGLGKTLESLMVACVVALAYISWDHVRAHPHLHKSKTSDQCTLGDAFGIQCFCDKSSLTRRICSKVPRRPQLVICPPGIVKQWIEEGNKALTATVVLRNGSVASNYPLLLMAYMEKGKLRSACHHNTLKLENIHFCEDLDVEGDLMNMRRLKNRRPLAEDWTTWTLKEALSNLPEYGLDVTHKALHRPITVQDTSVSRDRLVFVCSTNAVSAKYMTEKFTREFKIKQDDRVHLLTIRIKACFSPSTIFYDEFVEAKGENTQLVFELKYLASIHGASRDHRPLVVLLSGTPMPRGPVDLKGVLPLILAAQDVPDNINQLKAAYTKAFNVEGLESGLNPEDEDASIASWRALSAKILGRVMFYRWLGMEFLGGHVFDPRPPMRVHPSKFFTPTPDHRRKQAELTESLRKRVAAFDAVGAPTFATVRLTSEYQRSVRCSVIPSMMDLDEDTFVKLNGNSKTVSPVVRKNIQKLECAQLTALEDIVKDARDGESPRHGIVFALYPVTVCIAAEWLKYRLGDGAFIVELTADGVKPAKRSEFIDNLNDQATAHPDVPIVIVSTYGLMSTGLDGLQDFASYLVKLGEPWTNKENKQAEGRVHRPNQRLTVDVHGIHGGKGSIDYDMYMKNRKSLHLLPGGSIIRSLADRTRFSKDNQIGSSKDLPIEVEAD